ncbi:MAG TPA: DUF4331 family protein [Blastocatellia bacterium]|nr:DUF4331 family protein [Blastocatellia bacterium]
MLFLNRHARKIAFVALALTLAVGTLLLPAPPAGAADHGDAPIASNDRSADLNDLYFFLDPTDNSKVVMIITVHGFITPPEAVNFGIFDPAVRYRLELETTGDAVPDHFIDVTFSAKSGASTNPQTATIRSTFFSTFTAPTTVPNLSGTPPTPVITTDSASGISFFAGLSDDPFFFDIPGFNRFVASVLAGSADPTQLQRGRDSFAGYNTLSIAYSIPRTLINPLLQGAAGTTLGLDVRTARGVATGATTRPFRGATPQLTYTDVDRAATPAVNVALIPFARKNEFNTASTLDDQRGRFAPSIVATLTALGTNQTNIDILAGIAISKGDFLHLNLNTANSGPGAGTNSGAGFPNGRRLADDVIDTILFFIANQTTLGDNVNANDVPFRDAFPFLAPPAQPFASGTTDDRTRN